MAFRNSASRRALSFSTLSPRLAGLVLLTLPWLCLADRVSGALPELESFVVVQDGASNLDVGEEAAPEVADWDGDGRIDLIVGQYGYGYVRSFLNQGTGGAAPVFDGWSYLLSGGVNVRTGYDLSMGSGPRVVDWNSDGMKDLILGERYGIIHILLNEGTDAAPVFSQIYPDYDRVEVSGSDFDAGFNSMPFFVDWNNDGKRDLVCGEMYGHVYLLLNTGTAAAPAFSSASFIQDGSVNLDVGDRAAPVVCDWNDDGKKDLLCGNQYGNVYFFDNKGTDDAPAFSGWELLTAGGATLDVGFDSRPTVADWDQDGTPDLLVGESDGRVFFYRAVPPPPPLSTGESWILYE
ncbi:VCBS repeat-containing protein [Candidatus Sumerlaeota bacterium]|nr:VCBS repeat-containing protein [Candidatus Sumerlaeota bacterium]